MRARIASSLVVAVATGAAALCLVPGAAQARTHRTATYGSPLGVWRVVYGRDASHCKVGVCYGPVIRSRPATPQFSDLDVVAGRVVGWDEALPRGTTVLEAELDVAQLFPPDIQFTPKVTVIYADRYGHACAVYDLSSPTITTEFGPTGPAGSGTTIGVELFATAPGGATWNPNTVDRAIVAPTYLDRTANC